MVKVQRINVNGMLIYKWDVYISVTPKLRDHHRREDDMTSLWLGRARPKRHLLSV